MPSRPTIILARMVLVLSAAAAAVLVCEAAVRWLAPVPEIFPHWQWDAVPTDWQGRYETDSDLGYRPVLGTGEYSEFGTVVNDYPASKPAGTTRVLLLGDSVTHRGRIQRLLVKRCSRAPIEFWNAGVEGFNTGQEVEYYLRWNHRIRPDHVTLIFHNNDFVATPVMYRDDRGEVVIANPQEYLSSREVVLAARSHLFRYYLRWRVARMVAKDPITSAAETRAALARLERALAAEDIRFDVILMPVLKPLDEWTRYESRSRELSLEIFEALAIPVFDLIEPLEVAARDGLEMHESRGDIWHPSDEIARRFSRHLIRSGYLRSVLPPAGCG